MVTTRKQALRAHQIHNHPSAATAAHPAQTLTRTTTKETNNNDRVNQMPESNSRVILMAKSHGHAVTGRDNTQGRSKTVPNNDNNGYEPSKNSTNKANIPPATAKSSRQSKPPDTSPFLDLPGELRNYVYLLALGDVMTDIQYRFNGTRTRKYATTNRLPRTPRLENVRNPMGLSLVSKQIYAETKHMFIARSTLRSTERDLLRLLTEMNKEQKNHVNTVRLVFRQCDRYLRASSMSRNKQRLLNELRYCSNLDRIEICRGPNMEEDDNLNLVEDAVKLFSEAVEKWPRRSGRPRVEVRQAVHEQG